MSTTTTVARRLIAPLTAAAIALGLAGPAPAAAGEYTVLQCAAAHPGIEDARFDRINGADYGFGKHCTDAAEANSLQVRSITSAQAGRGGRISWLAPAGTRLVGVDVQARLRRDGGHQARLVYLDSTGALGGQLAAGSDAPSAFARFAARPTGGRAGFAALLSCEERDGCPQSDQARLWIRDVRLTLHDDVAPAVVLSGSLLAPGWRRGSHPLAARLSDSGSGLRSVVATVNGRPIGLDAVWSCATAAGTSLATRMQPCATSRSIGATLDTGRAPFVDGANVVRVCGRDFGAPPQQGCTQKLLFADNSAPAGSFDGPPAVEDPELIEATVTDAHSGLAGASIAYRPLAGGEWKTLPTSRSGSALNARVDSGAEEPGRYLFRIAATDAAGNTASITRRADGREMVLAFPLKAATSVSGSIAGPARVGYGERPLFSGALRAADGPLPAGETVIVSERFDPGSSPAVRDHRVRTDANGRFELRLSAGPSRRVVVGYAGSRRLQPSASAAASRLTVDGRASLKLSARRVRAGRRVRFVGGVEHLGAALPAAGKLVELQARERGSKRWRTIRQAVRTDERGRLRSAYRFGRFYTEPTVYRFRLKVTPENGWPYRSPTFSAGRRLRVLPR